MRLTLTKAFPRISFSQDQRFPPSIAVLLKVHPYLHDGAEKMQPGRLQSRKDEKAGAEVGRVAGESRRAHGAEGF
jgi:hypothetical protein